MEIIKQTSDLLIVASRRELWLIWSVGVFALFGGFFLIIRAIQGKDFLGNNSRVQLLLGGLSLLAFSFITFQSPLKLTCEFDKTKGKFSLEQQGLLGTNLAEYNLSGIEDIEFCEDDESLHDVYLVMESPVARDNYRLPIAFKDNSNESRNQKTISQIKKFLNLPETFRKCGNDW